MGAAVSVSLTGGGTSVPEPALPAPSTASAAVSSGTVASAMKVAVVGVGKLGSRIAAELALAGAQVNTVDVTPGSGASGEPASEVAKALQEVVTAGHITPEDSLQAIRRVHVCTSIADAVESAEWVVEACKDDIDAKRTILAEIEMSLSRGAIITSNSLNIPLATLREFVAAPEYLLVARFLYPVMLIGDVEVIAGPGESGDGGPASRAVQTLGRLLSRASGKIGFQGPPGAYHDAMAADRVRLTAADAAASQARAATQRRLRQADREEPGPEESEDAPMTGEGAADGPGAVEGASTGAHGTAADAKCTVTARAACSVVAINDPKSMLGIVSVHGPPLDELALESSRPPVSLAVVLDVSSSMSGQPLLLCKATLHAVINELRSIDKLSLVTFSSDVRVESLPLAMTPDGKAAMRTIVDRVHTTGCTNLSGGLFAGLDLFCPDMKGPVADASGPEEPRAPVKRSRRRGGDAGSSLATAQAAVDTAAARHKSTKKEEGKEAVRAVLLLTDGEANEGVCDTAALCHIISTKYTPLIPDVSVYTFGYGKRHNATMLREISTTVDGTYFFVENEETIPIAFAECLGGIVSAAATECVLTVKACNGASIPEILMDRDVTTVAVSKEYNVRLGSISQDAHRDIVLRVTLPKARAAQNDPIPYFTATLQYRDAMTSDRVLRTVVAAATVTRALPKHTPKAKPDLELVKHHNRVLVARALVQASARGDSGDLPGGRAIINKAKTTVLASGVDTKDPVVVQLVADLDRALEGLRDRVSYTSVGHSHMMSACSSHSRQRSNRSSAVVAEGCYSNAMQSHMSKSMMATSASYSTASSVSARTLSGPARTKSSPAAAAMRSRSSSNRSRLRVPDRLRALSTVFSVHGSFDGRAAEGAADGATDGTAASGSDAL